MHVKVLSRLFRGKFLHYLRQAFRNGKLCLEGKLRHLKDPGGFEALLKSLKRMEWVVYSKPPFGGPKQVLKYLARYTHRVAISNQRLVSMTDATITLRWKDYAHGNRQRQMTLNADEFIRRFLLHVLPSRFQRIRQYGLLANRVRSEKLALCRRLLGENKDFDAPTSQDVGTVDEGLEQHEGTESCPACESGRMVLVGDIEPDHHLQDRLFEVPTNDTS